VIRRRRSPGSSVDLLEALWRGDVALLAHPQSLRVIRRERGGPLRPHDPRSLVLRVEAGQPGARQMGARLELSEREARWLLDRLVEWLAPAPVASTGPAPEPVKRSLAPGYDPREADPLPYPNGGAP
jgi:hypothetical protein